MKQHPWAVRRRGQVEAVGTIVAPTEREGAVQVLRGRAWKGAGWNLKVGELRMSFDEEDVKLMEQSLLTKVAPGASDEERAKADAVGRGVLTESDARAKKQREDEEARIKADAMKAIARGMEDKIAKKIAESYHDLGIDPSKTVGSMFPRSIEKIKEELKRLEAEAARSAGLPRTMSDLEVDERMQSISHQCYDTLQAHEQKLRELERLRRSGYINEGQYRRWGDVVTDQAARRTRLQSGRSQQAPSGFQPSTDILKKLAEAGFRSEGALRELMSKLGCELCDITHVYRDEMNQSTVVEAQRGQVRRMVRMSDMDMIQYDPRRRYF